ATELRRIAGEPVIPVVWQRVGGSAGLARLDPPQAGSLSVEPTDWSRYQQWSVLADHAFAALAGGIARDDDMPVVIPIPDLPFQGSAQLDWSDALELDRGGAPPEVPSAAALLYMAYVRGDVDLDFGALSDAGERISRLGLDD